MILPDQDILVGLLLAVTAGGFLIVKGIQGIIRRNIIVAVPYGRSSFLRAPIQKIISVKATEKMAVMWGIFLIFLGVSILSPVLVYLFFQ